MTEDEGKKYEVDHKSYVSLSVTKSNYLAPIDPFWLYREDKGYLRKILLAAPKVADQSEILQAIRDQIIKLMKSDKLLSTRNFAEQYAGTTGPFKMGRQRLEQLVRRALTEGLISQSPASILQAHYKSAAKQRSNVHMLIVREA